MRYRNMSLLIAALTIAACRPSETTATASATPATAAAGATAPSAPAAKAMPDVTAGFTEGMAYADLRKRLLDAGWLPLEDPMCRDNVGGEARVCTALPEVESCSGDGHCVMHFAHAEDGRRLRVTSYGPYERWNVAGEEAAFAVKSWQASSVPASAKPVACPAQDFDGFLKAFAADASVQAAFTAPLVKVATLYSDDGGDHERTVYQAADGYREFNLDHSGGAFHFVDGDGRTDPSALKVEIADAGPDARIVRYGYGLSEGNAYRFERRDGCWYLTADPQAPTP